MARKRIETVAGGILPAKRALWYSADEKLAEATRAIHAMETAVDRIAYEAAWSRLVDSLEQFWARFEDEGKATFTRFPPWAGTIKRKRTSDPLLQYLKQARHQSQHGRLSLNWEEPRLLIAPGFNGHLTGLRIFSDATYEMDATPLHPLMPEPAIVHSPGEPLLCQIENNQHKQQFPPPKVHEGRLLADVTPLSVARAGLDFYTGVLNRTREKFGA